MKSNIDRNRPVSERMARFIMRRYGATDMQWHYEHGLVLQSIFLLGQMTGQDEFIRYVQSMYDSKITPAGDIISYRENEFNLDQINPGKTLFLLYAQYGEEKHRIAIEKLREQLRNHPRTKTGGFWHKKIYPWQMWLDGLYMQAPFYARYAVDFGDAADIDDIVHQFTLIESKARDRDTGLLYHAWDESREQLWANKDTGCSPHFWGRALGWYCMALVDVFEIIQAAYPGQAEELAAIVRRLFAPLLKYRDSGSGLWYQVMDRPGADKNYTESSASSMFVYFLLKAIRLGIAPESDAARLREAALSAYQGLLDHKVQEDENSHIHLTGICKVAGLGGNPYRDGSYEYYVNEPVAADDFKGVGPFILASMEREGICQEPARPPV